MSLNVNDTGHTSATHIQLITQETTAVSKVSVPDIWLHNRERSLTVYKRTRGSALVSGFSLKCHAYKRWSPSRDVIADLLPGRIHGGSLHCYKMRIKNQAFEWYHITGKRQFLCATKVSKILNFLSSRGLFQAGWAYDASPDPQIGCDGETNSPFPSLLDAFRRLDLAPSEPHFSVPIFDPVRALLVVSN